MLQKATIFDFARFKIEEVTNFFKLEVQIIIVMIIIDYYCLIKRLAKIIIIMAKEIIAI